MKEKVYDKLVRDHIPEIIEADGKAYSISYLDDDSYIAALKAKLVEEASELELALSNDEIVKEMADVYEVLEALKKVLNISDESVMDVKEKKALKNGRFEKRILLKSVIEE